MNTISEANINRVCNSDADIDNWDQSDPTIRAVNIAIDEDIQEVVLDMSDNEHMSDVEHQVQPTAQKSGSVDSGSDSDSGLDNGSGHDDDLYTNPHSSPSGKGKEKMIQKTISEDKAEPDNPETAPEERENKVLALTEGKQADIDNNNTEDDTEASDDDESEKEVTEKALADTDGVNVADPQEIGQPSDPNAQEPIDKLITPLLTAIQNHQKDRRQKMEKKYNSSHKIAVFEEGDLASLSIPKDDRAPTDNLRLIVCIIKKPYPNRYKVQCKYGILKTLVPTNSLNVVAEQLVPDLRAELSTWISPAKEILLSQAAALASNANRVALSCNCKKKCSKRCTCVKNSKPCTQYCHKAEFDCGNLPDTALELTEASIVPRAVYTGSLKAPKRKRAMTVASSSKPLTKRLTSTRNQPSTATPMTTRARAKKGDSKPLCPAEPVLSELNPNDQLTMSQFEPFAPLADRHVNMMDQLIRRPAQPSEPDPTIQSTLSHFQLFTPLAHRHITMTEQLAKKGDKQCSVVGSKKGKTTKG